MPAHNGSTTISDVLRFSRLPDREAELLLSFLKRKSREYLLTHTEESINPQFYKKFLALEKKRIENWPIAYLTGHKEFYGLNYKVTPAVLVPRPETEMIVDEVLSIIKETGSANIIDVGTGSGAITIAVATEIRRLFPGVYKKSNFTAIDISRSALQIARHNAVKHRLGEKIKFHRGNLLTPINQLKWKALPLVITANLPYLTPIQIKQSPSITREPKLALSGGPDGLKYYRQLFAQLKLLLADGRSCHLFCEIDPSQAVTIKGLAKKYFPTADTDIRKDLSGKKRLARVNIK